MSWLGAGGRSRVRRPDRGRVADPTGRMRPKTPRMAPSALYARVVSSGQRNSCCCCCCLIWRGREMRSIGRGRPLSASHRARIVEVLLADGGAIAAGLAVGCSSRTAYRVWDDWLARGRRCGQSRLRLSLVEREQISRGLAAGESLRQIGRQLGRAGSTISREVAANGGRERYRRCVLSDARSGAPRAPSRESWRRVHRCARRCRKAWISGGRRSRSPPYCGPVPRRSGDAHQPRDDLPVAVCAEQGRVAPPDHG